MFRLKKVFKNIAKQIRKLTKTLGFGKKQPISKVSKNACNLGDNVKSLQEISDAKQNFTLDSEFLSQISWNFLDNDNIKDKAGYEKLVELRDETIYDNAITPVYKNIPPYSMNYPRYDYLPPARPISELKTGSLAAISQLDKSKIKDIYQLMLENDSTAKEIHSFER